MDVRDLRPPVEDGPWPPHDVVAAVRYLRRYAEVLGVDASRLQVSVTFLQEHLRPLPR